MKNEQEIELSCNKGGLFRGEKTGRHTHSDNEKAVEKITMGEREKRENVGYGKASSCEERYTRAAERLDSNIHIKPFWTVFLLN